MKTLVKSVSILVVAILVSASVKAEIVNEHNNFGEFNVEEVEDVLTNSKEVSKIYTITYKELNSPVTVEVFKNGKQKDFVVRSKGFEAQYTKGKDGFGVKKLDAKYAKVDKEAYTFEIDRRNYLYQRVITQTYNSESDYVELIACYLPELVKRK